ncbi:MAG TPA: lasso peptide biosynthesis B2 protein [Solirubrobacteraceae bacterium]
MIVPRVEPSAAGALPGRGRFSPIERVALTLEVTLAYAHARHRLRHSPLESVLSSLRARFVPRAAPPADGTLAHARRLGRVVARVLGILPGDTRCLVRSLVLTQLLARRGIATTLVIGARTSPDFLAHAWVEYDGEPVLSPGDGSFGRLAEL